MLRGTLVVLPLATLLGLLILSLAYRPAKPHTGDPLLDVVVGQLQSDEDFDPDLSHESMWAENKHTLAP